MTGLVTGLLTVLVFWGCARTAPAAEDARTAGDVFHDALITASVKTALAFKPGVAAMDINVDTDQSVVTLRVGTEAERQLAVMVAEDVGGVTEVVNELRVGG
jgi:osmotically-inducible protein OsmY